MKVLHISANDIEGGAGKAAYRLHKGLLKAGINSHMLVLNKRTDDPEVLVPSSKLAKFVRPRIDSFPLKVFTGKMPPLFSVNWLPSSFAEKINNLEPDIVHLHWINAGFLSIASLAKIKAPIVWTLHDTWAFTGGCHHFFTCNRYMENCGKCPYLESDRNYDVSRWIWNQKAKHWHNLNMQIVTPSRWMAASAKKSSLFGKKNISTIPNGLDISVFKPIEPGIAREILNLPSDKYLILFGAVNARSYSLKGFGHLQKLLNKLAVSSIKNETEAVIFGALSDENDAGLKTHFFGNVHDEYTMALLYSAADVFVAPSLQDNLPNTVVEALACGTPTVAFNIGGMPDMIEHKKKRVPCPTL